MNAQAGEAAVVGAGVAYLAALSWAMTSLSYDIWGALVVTPIYGVLGAALIRQMFGGSLQPVARALYWGLLIKLGGAAARYWVGFEAYDGGIDAARYHDYATDAAGAVWSGERNFLDIIPTSVGTEFVDQFTALVYALTGGSQLAGFVTFSFFAYIGIIFVVKAAVTAVPGLAARRYAWMCVLFPSIVYWPSSIGKESIVMLGLGVGTYGIARLLTYGHWFSSLMIIGCGIGFAGVIRPHMAGIWIAATLPGLLVALVHRMRSNGAVGSKPRSGRLGLVVVLLVAIAGFALIAAATIRFLAPLADDSEAGTTDSLTQIIEETTRRTGQAGSTFVPPSVSNPAAWPYAITRTLTRPLPFEASGLAQLVSAAEMTALLGIYALSWTRLRNLPRLAISNGYVAFVVTAILLVGLAYTSLANLGILTRQKSLIIPLLVLLPCLPARVRRSPDAQIHACSRPDELWGHDDGTGKAPARSALQPRVERQ